MRERLNLLREFSVPLLSGVVFALFWANSAPASYLRFLHNRLIGSLSLHFLTNDIFMVFFFAIAAVEITRSLQTGGDLYPIGKSINPLFATAGGVIGPALVYLTLNHLVGVPELQRGWGIPTSTDIAFAWLVARLIFGKRHPAISFLLLLAVVDDGIGLAIIALFYPDPLLLVEPQWLFLTLAGMAIAYFFRKRRVRSYWPYVLLGGGLSWAGLYRAHLHPALALVFIIPFLPHAGLKKKHLFEEDGTSLSPMALFEHEWKVVVDLGLFLFGFANAGVELSRAGAATWLVVSSLVMGKCIGIFLFSIAAARFGFPLPAGVRDRDLIVIGIIGGIGFTVALFVSGEAFADPALQNAAKMGSMLSCGAAVIALIAGKLLKIKKLS